MFIFGLSNGYVTSSIYSLGPEQVKKQINKYNKNINIKKYKNLSRFLKI